MAKLGNVFSGMLLGSLLLFPLSVYANEEGGHGEAAAPYYNFDPPLVSNIHTSRVGDSYLQAKISIFTDIAMIEHFKFHDAQLRDAILDILSEARREDIAANSISVQDDLQKKITKAVQEIMKKEGFDPKVVKQIIFTDFLMQ